MRPIIPDAARGAQGGARGKGRGAGAPRGAQLIGVDRHESLAARSPARAARASRLLSRYSRPLKKDQMFAAVVELIVWLKLPTHQTTGPLSGQPS